jgi:DNA-binding transcriptional LysR family regulator
LELAQRHQRRAPDPERIHAWGCQTGGARAGNARRYVCLRRFEPNQSLQTDISALALALAEAGAGVALGHGALVADLLASRRLIAPFETALPIQGVFHLVHPRERKLRPEAALLRDWLLSRGQRTGRYAA